MPTKTTDLPTPTDPALAERLELMRQIADHAETINLEHYQRSSLQVDVKPDGSVVTPADKETERMARQLIEQHFPDDAITGEEFPPKDTDSPYRWIIDPIDGTDSFTRGIHSFANLLAVCEHGTPVLGLANFPAINERLTAATGAGCIWHSPHKAPEPARVSNTASIDAALLELTRPKSFAKRSLRTLHDTLAHAVSKTRGWSDALAFALVATGRTDAAAALRMSIWDVAPFHVIIHEAGGSISEFDGTKPITGASTLATNAKIHQQLLDLIASVPSDAP